MLHDSQLHAPTAPHLDAIGWRIWEADPGSQDISLPAPLNMLDIHLGGSPAAYYVHVIDGDGRHREATSTSLPESFSFLPSGRPREIRTARSGRAVRIVLTDDEVRARSHGSLAMSHPLMHVVDPALVGAAAAFSRSRLALDNNCSHLAADPFITLLVTRVLHLAGIREIEHPFTRLSPVQKAIAYIEEHLGSTLALAEVAASAGVSQFHFARVFRAAMGTSLHDYILGRRVVLAERLIHETDAGLAKIAFQAGFGSQSHMTTVFRRRTGRTPGEHRRASS